MLRKYRQLKLRGRFRAAPGRAMTDSRKAKTCDSFGYEFEEFLLAIDYNLAFAAANGCIGPPRLQHNINNFGLDCDSCDAARGPARKQ